MASERRSSRQAKIIKKEPTFAIASSIAEQEQDSPENWIEIDLAKALPGISITESMHIIIEGVPDGARFSMGRNNGDKTWSLEPWDLADLSYLPPPGHSAEDQNFFVRLLTYDPDGYQIASTTAQVAVSVDGVTARPPIELEHAEAGAGAVDAIRELEFGQRLAEAERNWQAAEVERTQQLEATWHNAMEERLRAAEEEWRQAEADRHQTLQDQLTEMARRLRDAEMEWHRAESERISAALAQAADFTAQRFAAAEEQWRKDAERQRAEFERSAEERLAQACAEVENAAAARIAEAHAEAQAAAAARIAEARAEAERESESQFADRAAEIAQQLEASHATQLALAASRLQEMESAIERLKQDAESARRANERELSERQAAWELERAALLASSSQDIPTADKITALEERWRNEVDRRVQEAEARVRREAEQHLAQAEASWAQIGERRMLDAQREWEEAAERRLAERNESVATRSEQHLAEMRTRMAEVERLAAEAERRIALSERQVSEAATARHQAEQALVAAEQRLQEELERRLLEAEAAWQAAETDRLNAAKATWTAEEANRLAEAQARWMSDEDERLQTAIAAERVMLAGSDVGDMLNQAELRWREAESERLRAAEERWKMEEDRRVAAAVAAAHEDMERMVEARLHRELAVDARRLLGRSGGGLANAFSLLRFAVAGAAAAVVGTGLYIAAPQLKSLIADTTTAVAADPMPAVVDARPAESAAGSLTVAAEFVNLRAEPSQSATIVARLERGTAVIATERRSNWVKVAETRGGSEGWIYAALLNGSLPPEN
jgi:hypothetical protein